MKDGGGGEGKRVIGKGKREGREGKRVGGKWGMGGVSLRHWRWGNRRPCHYQ